MSISAAQCKANPEDAAYYIESQAAEIERLREERRALQRMAWLVIKKFGGCVLRRGDMEDYPGDDRITIITAENPTTKAVSYSAGVVDQQAAQVLK